MQLETYKKREKNNVTESTLNSRMSGLNNLQNFLGTSTEPEPPDIEDWMDHLIDEFDAGNVKSGTIKQYYKAVKYYWTKIHGSPEEIEHIRDWIPQGSTDHGDYLERDEWDKLKDAVTSFREQAIIDLMYYYARRPGEIVLLNHSDLDMERGTITFNILKKDTAQRATFELRPEVRESLENYFMYKSNVTVEGEYDWEDDEVEPVFVTTHGRISYDTVWKKIKNLTDKAGIDKNITPKSMRHSRTTHLDRAGQSPDVIAHQQLLHGADSDVVSHYIHPRGEEDVREVMELDDE